MKSRLLLLSVLPTSLAFAQLFQCPGTNNYIAAGDSVQTVIQKCGEPAAYRNRNAQSVAQQSYLLWVYNDTSIGPKKPTIGHFGHQVFFDVMFHDGKVGAMRVRGQRQFQKTHPCHRGPIKLGDTIQQVTMMCGLPVHQQVIQPRSTAGGKTAQDLKPATILIYTPNGYSGSKSLVFENDKLVGIS